MSAQVHTFTTRRDRFTVRSVASPLAEHAVALWTALEQSDKRRSSELGDAWFVRIADGLSDSTMAKARRFGGELGAAWAAVAQVAAVFGPGGDGDELAWLRTFDFTDVMPLLLDGWYEGADDSAVSRALSGDPAALEEVLSKVSACSPEGVGAFVRADPTAVGAEIADVLEELMASVLADLPQLVGESLTRSAAHVSARVSSMSPIELIEEATNGITVDLPLGTTGVVLVPSVVVRPWSMMLELGSTAVIIHPVADGDFDADCDAVPRWLVAYHKALGDERRLRMLRQMAQGDASLADLAAVVGLSKSTVIHHLAILRAAGFVRTRLRANGTTSYSLRTDSVPDARGALDSYLKEQIKEVSGART